MTINNVNVSTYNAKQRTVSFYQHNTIQGYSEWLPGSPVPYLSNQYIRMKPFTVTLWVYGANREAISQNVSLILSKLLVPVDLTLDGFTHKFRGTLKSHKETEGSVGSVNRWHVLELTFEGYEYGSDIVFSGTGSVVVSNPGNIVSPAAVEITTTVSAASVRLTGVCRDLYTGDDIPCVIPDVTAGKTVRMDTLTGKVTQQGYPKDVDIWTLPSFKPGNTTVACSNSNCSIVIVLRPFYM